MKLSNWIIIVLIVFGSFILPANINQENKIEADQLKRKYDLIIEKAVRSGSNHMIDVSNNISFDKLADGYSMPEYKLSINLDNSLNAFFKSLYISFGIQDDPIKQQQIKQYIPAVIITAYDGYYVNYNTIIDNQYANVWDYKKSFAYYDEENELILNFTLDDYLYIYDCSTGIWIEGYRDILNNSLNLSYLSDDSKFDDLRKQVIVNAISKDVEILASTNKISNSQGITYKLINNYVGENTFSNPCFIAFFQGLPVSGLNTYNTFAFNAHKIVKATKFVGNSINGTDYYHKESCDHINNGTALSIFDTKIEAAQNKYYPCPYCNP